MPITLYYAQMHNQRKNKIHFCQLCSVLSIIAFSRYFYQDEWVLTGY